MLYNHHRRNPLRMSYLPTEFPNPSHLLGARQNSSPGWINKKTDNVTLSLFLWFTPVFFQAISAKHFQQMQDEATSSASHRPTQLVHTNTMVGQLHTNTKDMAGQIHTDPKEITGKPAIISTQAIQSVISSAVDRPIELIHTDIKDMARQTDIKRVVLHTNNECDITNAKTEDSSTFTE